MKNVRNFSLGTSRNRRYPKRHPLLTRPYFSPLYRRYSHEVPLIWDKTHCPRLLGTIWKKMRNKRYHPWHRLLTLPHCSVYLGNTFVSLSASMFAIFKNVYLEKWMISNYVYYLYPHYHVVTQVLRNFVTRIK